MLHFDENDVAISKGSVLEKLEQLCSVIKLKWILLASGAGMLFYAIIIIGLFTANNARDLPDSASSDLAPQPMPDPVVEYVDEPTHIVVEAEDEYANTAAHDKGTWYINAPCLLLPQSRYRAIVPA